METTRLKTDGTMHMSQDPESEYTSQASTCSPDEIYDEFLKALAVQDGLNEFSTKIDEYLNEKIRNKRRKK